jgi:LEA14-like dessication related protein
MDERALVDGVGTLKVVVAAVGLVVASVGGAFALGVVGAPSVEGVENRFGDVTNRTTVVETDLLVRNPNPIGVQLGGTTVNYTVAMNDVDIAGGSKEGLDVESGDSTLNFTTRMQNTKIPDWWYTHVSNGEVTNVTVDADIRTSLLGDRTFELQQRQRIETDIIGAFASDETRPINASRPLVSDPVLFINRTDAQYGSVTESETPIAMQFDVYNPKTQPYAITEVGYEVTMNGILVGEGATEETYLIPGGTQKTVRTTPTIANERLDEWWVSHLRNDQITDLRIDFYAKVELPTGNEIRVPLEGLTYERTIETDIFGNKEETSADAGGSGETSTGDGSEDESEERSGTGTPTPTADGGLVDTATDATDTATGGVLDGTSTAEPTTDGGAAATPTPTPAPTATPTPTDDGGLLALD